MDEIFIIISLILLNGIFAMSEIAIISARKSSLSTDIKKGSKAAEKALKLANEPDKFLSTVQIGITLIGILTGIYSGSTVADDFGRLLESWSVPARYSHIMAQGVIVILVTYLTIIFGELVPKRIGLSLAEKVSKIIARPMAMVSIAAAPFVWLLSKSSSSIFRLLGIKETGSKVTEEEIKSIIKEGTEDGEVQEVEQDIMERVFLLGDLKVNSLMTHRSDVVALDINMTKSEMREILERHLYEMYPVIDKNFDNVKGVVRLKNLVFRLDKDANLELKEVISAPVFFHENMSVYKVLEHMKEKHIGHALVCDEFGSCMGMITLKDILGGLVGTVTDSQSEPDIIQRSDMKSWLIDGQCSIYDFLCYFEKEELYENCNYNTVGGLILELLKDMPHSGQQVSWNNFHLEIVDMDGVRIDKVLVSLSDEKSAQDKA